MKEYIINFSEHEDEFDERQIQKVWSDDPDEKIEYRVCDLCDCPEDATINRDLFNGRDFIRAIEFGFRLAKKGYDNIVVKEVEWEE